MNVRTVAVCELSMRLLLWGSVTFWDNLPPSAKFVSLKLCLPISAQRDFEDSCSTGVASCFLGKGLESMHQTESKWIKQNLSVGRYYQDVVHCFLICTCCSSCIFYISQKYIKGLLIQDIDHLWGAKRLLLPWSWGNVAQLIEWKHSFLWFPEHFLQL